MATPQFNIRLDSDLKEAFLSKARSEGKAGSDLIVAWIKQYLGVESDDAPPLPSIYTAIDERVDTLQKELQAQFLAMLEERLGKSAA